MLFSSARFLFPLLLVVLLAGFPILAAAGGSLLREMESELASMVQRVHPSVVTISARQPSSSDRGLVPGEGARGSKLNIGSGVVFDQQGHILTTTHVVANASDIVATFVSGEEVPARLLGTDADSHIAVLKVDHSPVECARLSDSNTLQPNHWAVILGNASGLFPSASLGLICGWRDESGLFQITAPSCPGTSGAPVFDSSGDLIGMIVFAIADGGAVQAFPGGTASASLAVPINRARMVVEGLVRKGAVDYGWLGAGFAREDNHAESPGACVSHLVEGGPAIASGIEQGDRILEFGRIPVRSVYQLAEMARCTPPGSIVPVRVQRGDRLLTRLVTVGSRRSRDATMAGALEGAGGTGRDEASVPSAPAKAYNVAHDRR